MKNLKTIALGLVVGAMAIGFSSFTNAKRAEGDQYANTTSGQYTKLSNPYNSMKCANLSDDVCGYTVTEDGASHVTANFSSSDAATFVSNGWIESIETKGGLYSGN